MQLDVALRIRNLGWFWLLKNEAGISDDQLDQRFASRGGFERRRCFFQVRSTGSSPDRIAGARRRQSLFDCVHEEGGFVAAKSWFEAPVWQVLVRPDFDRGAVGAVLMRILEAQGWYRSSEFRCCAGNRFLPDMQAFKVFTTDEYSARLAELSKNPSTWILSLLSVLLLEAEVTGDIEIADLLFDYIGKILDAKVFACIPEEIRKLLLCTIRQRFVERNVLTWEDAPEDVHAGSTRKARITNFANWLLLLPYQKRPADCGKDTRSFAVPINEKLEWFERNYEDLQKLHLSYKFAPLLFGGAADFNNQIKKLRQRFDDLVQNDPILNRPGFLGGSFT